MITKYIIQCGCDPHTETPKHFHRVNGERIVERVIRLLRENGITDISISSNHTDFKQFGLPILQHPNPYYGNAGTWVDGFYPIDLPVCYVFGDVVFSPEAIKTIISTDTDDIEFFASAPPFAKNYIKPWAEPFAFKVRNQEHFQQSLVRVKELKSQFNRDPIAWELWQVIKGTPINQIDYTNYTVINDYTCDVDSYKDAKKFNEVVFTG